jgi:hypothetical protein
MGTERKNMSGFDIAAVLDEAWSLTKRQYWYWLLVIVVAVAIPVAIIVVGVVAAIAVPALGAIVIFLGILGFFYTFLGILRNAYNASEGAKPSVGVLLRSDRYWWFLVAGLVYTGIVVVGFFAFIIPGIILAFMFALFPYALIGNPGMTGFAALAMSWELITTSFWRFIGFRIVLIGATVSITVVASVSQSILIGGADDFNLLTGLVSVIAFILVLFVNVFVAAFTYLADALAYRRLSGDGEVVRPG